MLLLNDQNAKMISKVVMIPTMPPMIIVRQTEESLVVIFSGSGWRVMLLLLFSFSDEELFRYQLKLYVATRAYWCSFTDQSGKQTAYA